MHRFGCDRLRGGHLPRCWTRSRERRNGNKRFPGLLETTQETCAPLNSIRKCSESMCVFVVSQTKTRTLTNHDRRRYSGKQEAGYGFGGVASGQSCANELKGLRIEKSASNKDPPHAQPCSTGCHRCNLPGVNVVWGRNKANKAGG